MYTTLSIFLLVDFFMYRKIKHIHFFSNKLIFVEKKHMVCELFFYVCVIFFFNDLNSINTKICFLRYVQGRIWSYNHHYCICCHNCNNCELSTTKNKKSLSGTNIFFLVKHFNFFLNHDLNDTLVST